MKKRKCNICSKVKGRRLCKIKEKYLICSLCCAETRNSSCSGCTHYSQAEKYAIEKMKKSHFRDVTALFDPEIDKAVDEALTFVENGNIAKGEELLTDLIEKYPNLHIVQYGMGTVLAIKGDYVNSITYFNKCLEIFPCFVEAWFNKGNSHKSLLDLGNTIKSFQKVIEFGDREDHFVISAHEVLNDMETQIQHDTGLSLTLYVQSIDEFDKAFSKMQNQEYEKAITGFQNVLAVNKNTPPSYGNLGLCYSFIGENKKALSAFDKALEIDPKYEPAMKNRMIIASLKDGEKLPENQFEIIDFYKNVVEEKEKK